MNQNIENVFDQAIQNTADARDAVSDVISENSKLNGDFESSGNIEIRGSVMGNVVIDGMLVLHGAHVEGDVKAKMVYMSKGTVNGSIQAESIVDIDGTVGGSVDGDKVIVRKDSVVSGQYIHCQSIAVETGAQIDCSVKTGYIPSLKDIPELAVPVVGKDTTSSKVTHKDKTDEELVTPVVSVMKKDDSEKAEKKSDDDFSALFDDSKKTANDDTSDFLAADILAAINNG